MSNLSVTPILEYAIKKWASDIHITEWSFLMLRINWKLTPLESNWKLEKVKVNQILLELLNEQKELIKEFISNKDLDFSYTWTNWISFRINAYYKLWKIALVLRKIEAIPRTYEELMLPQWAQNISNIKSWLVIVSWTSWSWKSTTVTSILDNINKNRSEHIITLENPVEFIHKDQKSIFSHRNIWRDTKNLQTALKSTLREDPNIVMIWEIDNKETLDSAINMAKSWILVISTINATSTIDMMNKLIWYYDTEEKSNISGKLSTVISCTIFQQLVDNINEWEWRLAVFEVMLLNNNIELLIKAWKINELQSAIHIWLKDWMTSALRYAEDLVKKWLITEEFKEKNFFID